MPNVVSPSGFSQLRNLSEYSQDRISTEHTYFVLHDADAADFGWASEWTHMTVNAYSDKTAIFLWHSKDGSKAYSQQGDYIGDAGGALGYLLTGKAANLEDARHNKIRPLSRTNYPVKVELWIGEIGDSTGFSPQTIPIILISANKKETAKYTK